jgi:hypothetical protein
VECRNGGTGTCGEEKPPLPIRRREQRKHEQQRTAKQRIRKPDGRQGVAHRFPVRVGGEQQEAQRRPAGKRRRIGRQPAPLVAVDQPEHHDGTAEQRQIDEQLEADRE